VVGWSRPRPAASGATAADLALTIAPTAGSIAPGDLHATTDLARRFCRDLYRNIASAGSGAGVKRPERTRARTSRLGPQKSRIGPTTRSFVFSDGTNLKRCVCRTARKCRKRRGHDGGRS
jgi:hypothetical protein